MITKKKKYTLYYVMALACGLVASFFIYSCSTDGYYSDEIEKNEVTNTRALSSRMINNGSTLIDSIASSDEFWEFEAVKNKNKRHISRQKLIMTMLSLTVKMVQCHLAA